MYFNDTSKNYVGLFGAVGSEGTIQNIGVVDSYFEGKEYVGAVCGYNKGKITNCYNEGSVNSKGKYGGGVCGNNSRGTITGCYNTGTINGNDMYTGGVCGYNYNGLITDCYNTGVISSGESYTGGVCAINYAGCTINNSYNIGEISGTNRVGGVSGDDGGTITNCYNEGNISGKEYVGGVSGIISSGLITNSYSKGTVNSTSSSNTGGVYGRNDKGNAVNCYYLAENANNNGGRTQEQFYSGEVAYLLSQGCSIDTNTYDGSIWGQDLSESNHFPELNGKTVYSTTPCPSYSNDVAATKNHSFSKGICTACGAYEPPHYDENLKRYEISSANDLYWFTNQVNTGNTEINAVLTKDIVMNQSVLNEDGTLKSGEFKIWTPIGGGMHPYNGIFEGNGKTVSGLYIKDPETSYAGFFGYVGSNCQITDLGILDSYFEGNEYVGAVCGYNCGTIKNCYNTGTVKSDNKYEGGICGYNYSGTVIKCYNKGNVSGKESVGGLSGYNNTGTIKNCSNAGTISGTQYVGGACGKSIGTIQNCYNGDSVTGTQYVGGVCGETYSRIQNCYNTGKVSGTEYVYGISKIFGGGIIVDCYYLAGCNAEGTTFGDSCSIEESAFTSGEITYRLQGDQKEDYWGQILGVEDYPVLGGAKVSATTGCIEYNNDGRTERKEHEIDHETFICSVCGKYDAAILTTDKYDLNGDGTKDEVYEISSAGQLYWFANEVNNRYRTEINGILTENIVVNDGDVAGCNGTKKDGWKDWTPIGNEQDKYAGIFDGNGHTVSGLYFNDTKTKFVGLFGYVNGTIQNVGVINSYFIAHEKVGGICGENHGTINNCYHTGSVKGWSNVGGVCGCIISGTVAYCYNTGSVNEIEQLNGSLRGSEYLGGVCGYNRMGTVTYCYNTGNVKGRVDGSQYVGGVCGYIGAGTVTYCYNTGSITRSVSGTKYVGGVCGGSGYSTITNCYFDSTVYDGNDDGEYTESTFQNVLGKSTDAFKSGEVAYLLNSGKTDGTQNWYQNIDEGTKDTYPVLNNSHGTVYPGTPCTNRYANTPEKQFEHIYEIDIETTTNHKCKYCGDCGAHALSDLSYKANEEVKSITVTCDVCEGTLGTITLSVPAADSFTYDGVSAASVSGTVTCEGFKIPEIVYEKETADGSFEKVNGTPKSVGTYMASITLGEGDGAQTVSVQYTISPATPAIAWSSNTKTVCYTANAITEEIIGTPTVTLVNGEEFTGTIEYSYRASGSDDAFTEGLPREIGTYEVKASVAAAGNYTQAEKNMMLTIAWLSDVEAATLTDQSDKSLTGDDWWAQSVTFTPPTGYTICGTVDGTYGDSYSYDKETEKAGTDVTYYLKNSAGEIAQKSATVRIDTTAPDWSGENDGISIKTNKWKSLLSTISFGLFYNETVDVTVSASDSLSGVAKYYYYVDTSEGTDVKTKEELDALVNAENGFKEYAVTDENATQNITSLSADNNYVVYVYAVDAVGNKSDYICSNGVVIDKAAPTIRNISTPSKGSGDDATLTDTTADMTFTADEAGTYFYIVKAGSEEAPTEITDFATSSVNAENGMTVWKEKEGVTAAVMTADGNNKLSLTGLTANTAYTVYVIGVDQAGNVSNILSKAFTTCKTIADITTKPTISGTYGDTVSAMKLTEGIAKVGETKIAGTWTLADTKTSNVPVVGTTNTYAVTFTPNDSQTYETITVQVKPTVDKKPVTVTAEDKTKTFGQENPEFTFTVPEGALVGSDSKEALAVKLSCEATANSPVTTEGYAITGTSSSANYEVTVTQGTLTITRADAEINVGETSYNKTFGDAAFNLGVTDTNTDENVQYTVSDSKNAANTAVENDKVITVDAKGNVTIVGAGSATITVSLPESTNYNAAESKTITVKVAKNSSYSVDAVNKGYLYSRDNTDTIDLSAYLPKNCGTVTYGAPQIDENLYTATGAPAVSDGKLTYTVAKADTHGATGTIQVTVTTDNYEVYTITINVKRIDKIPVSLKADSSVSLVSNTLTYGEALSTLTFNSAVFVGDDGEVVEGTLAWKTPTATPDAGTTSAAWLFTPDSIDYDSLEGNVAIEVKKATPNVTAVPTVAERTYNPNVALEDSDLTDGTVLNVNGTKLTGTWSWENADVVPTVNNNGYTAVFTPTGEDKDNYETITKTITVNVSKATPFIKTEPTAAAITYGQALSNSELSGAVVQYSDSDITKVEGTFAWKEAAAMPTVADSENTTYTVVFTPADEVNYKSVETDITLTVNKAETAPDMPESTMSVPYNNEKVSDVTLQGSWLWQEADRNTELTVGTAVTATAVYNGTDKGNYATETVEISITRQACDHKGCETEVKNDKAATCTEKGYTGDTYCKVCQSLISESKEIEALGHEFAADYTVDVEPTCAMVGSKSKHCSRCNEKTEVTEIPMVNHTWDAGTVTKEPTETTEGEKTYTCTVCGKTNTEVIPKKEAAAPELPQKGDVVQDDKASAKVEIADVTKKEVEYKAPANKKAKTVTIPATVEIDGVTYKVTKIADNAFKGNKTVTKVTIGSNIKTIGKNAFSGATKLKKVTIGKNVTEIEANAFKGCSSLTSITLPSNVTEIGANAFSGCKKLKTLTIKSTKLTSKTVAKNAFKGLTKETTIKVPKKKLEAYKKLFKQKGLSSKVKVKGY